MVSATTQFTVIAQTTSQSDLSPSVGINAGGAGFNYPQYVPVSVPQGIPSREAKIVNVNAPQNVLPASSFNIICTFKTFVTTQKNYIVHISIPQLQLEHDSEPTALSNLSTGTALFTVTLPHAGPESFGLITGTLTLKNSTDNTVDDSTPFSIQVLGGAEVVPLDHHIDNIPTGVIAPIPTTTGFDAVIIANSTGNILNIESHGFQPFEDVDLNIDIPMLGKHISQTIKADVNGIIRRTQSLIKNDISKVFPTILHTHGHQSSKEGHLNINL